MFALCGTASCSWRVCGQLCPTEASTMNYGLKSWRLWSVYKPCTFSHPCCEPKMLYLETVNNLCIHWKPELLSTVCLRLSVFVFFFVRVSACLRSIVSSLSQMHHFIVHLYLTASNLQTPPTHPVRKVRKKCVKQNKAGRESKWEAALREHAVLRTEYKWVLFGLSKISPITAVNL